MNKYIYNQSKKCLVYRQYNYKLRSSPNLNSTSILPLCVSIIELAIDKYVTDQISKEVYGNFFKKYADEKRSFELELEKVNFELSNPDEYVDFSVKMVQNIAHLWQRGDFDTKLRLQNLVYPEGITYDKKIDSY